MDIDHRQAAAESRLDRLDEDELEAPSQPVADTLVEDDGIHVEHWFDDPVDDAEDADDHDGSELAECLDTFAEVYNARDLDGILELVSEDCEAPGLGNDLEHFPDAIEDLWQRRPHTLLTRGRLDGGPVGLLWEFVDDEWWRLATVHLATEEDRIGVVAFSDDAQLLQAVEADTPEREVDEGVRWREWDEGAGS